MKQQNKKSTAGKWGICRAFVRKQSSRLVELLQGDELVGEVVGNSAGTFVARSAGMAISFLVQVILARLLGSRSYGDYAYVLTWATTLIFLGRFGFEIASVRFVADYKAQENWELLKGYLRRSTQIVLIFSVLMAIVGFFIVGGLKYRDGISDSLISLFLMASPFFVAVSLLSAQNGMLRGDGQPVIALTLQYVVYPLLAVGFVLVYATMGYEVSPLVALGSNLCAAVIAVLLQKILLWRSLRVRLNEVIPQFTTREWLLVAFSMAVVSGNQLLLNRSGTLFVGAAIGTEKAGIYSVANRVLQIVRLGMLVTNIASAHLFSKLYSTNHRHELQRLVSIVAKLGFFSTLPIILGLFIWGNFVLGAFGDEFVEGLSVLRILLIGETINLLTGPTSVLMNMADCHEDLAKIMMLTVFLNFLLMFVLLRSGCGTQGVAIATTLTVGASNVISAVRVWNKVGINPSLFS